MEVLEGVLTLGRSVRTRPSGTPEGWGLRRSAEGDLTRPVFLLTSELFERAEEGRSLEEAVIVWRDQNLFSRNQLDPWTSHHDKIGTVHEIQI